MRTLAISGEQFNFGEPTRSYSHKTLPSIHETSGEGPLRSPESRRGKIVATVGQSYGGPSEKFVGTFEVNFQKLPPNFSEGAFMCKSPDATHLGASS